MDPAARTIRAGHRLAGLCPAAAFILAILAPALGPALSTGAWGAEVRVAVASNFILPLRALKQDFESRTGDRVRVSPGSTGGLYAQIINGAPFDVLLAADMERPRRLVEEKFAVAGSRRTYARGRLVLYSTVITGRDGDCRPALKEGRFTRLAIANPKTAPYGAAAQQTLEGLGLWKTLRKDLLRGANIAQAFQWVDSGNADMGLVALSQVILKGRAGNSNRGCRWIVPESYHQPLDQQMVLLTIAAAKPAARDFIAFLETPASKAAIRRMGYLVD